MIQQIFLHVMEVSIVMSLIIFLVCLFSPIADKKYVARWKYYVWLGITIRLLFPISISVPDAPIHIDTRQVFQETSNPPALILSGTPIHDQTYIGMAVETPVAPQGNSFTNLSTLEIATILWAVGALVFSIYHLVGYFHFARSNKRWSTDALPVQKVIFSRVKEELGIRRSISLRRSTHIKSPMMYGIIQPTVAIPPVEYTETDFYLIMKHELTHFRRHDIELKIALFVVRTLHWFNPFVHLMSKKFNETIELICDEHVVRGKDNMYKKRYMETILQSVEQQTPRSSILTSNYNGGLKVVKKRFQNIVFGSSKKKGIMALALLTIVCIISSSLIVFGAYEETADPLNDTQARQDSPIEQDKIDSPKPQEPADKIVGLLAEAERMPALEKVIIHHFELPEEVLGETKYYYNYVDLNGDGKDELFTVVFGPYTSGSGGSMALILTETDAGELHVNQELTLIQTPIIISDKVTNGYKEIIVMNSGGGAEGNYVILTANKGQYTSVNDGTVIESLNDVSGKAIISNDIPKDMEEGKAFYLQQD